MIDFKLDKLTETEEYELLLAQILFSSMGKTSIEEIYASNFNEAVMVLCKALLTIKDAFKLSEKDEDGKRNIVKIIEEFLELIKRLDTTSEEYNKAYEDLFNMLDNYNDDTIKNRYLDQIKIEKEFKNAKGDFILGAIMDEMELASSTLAELSMYIAAGKAYMDTADVFGDIILGMRQRIGYPSENPIFNPTPLLSDEIIVEEGLRIALGMDKATYYDHFKNTIRLPKIAKALENFYTGIEEYKNGNAQALANNAIEKMAIGTGDILVSNGTQAVISILSSLPVIKEYKVIKDFINAGKFIIDMTRVDDIAYMGTMILRLYCLSYILYPTIDNLAGTPHPAIDNSVGILQSWETPPINSIYGDSIELIDYQFTRALTFDEAINIYKAIINLAATYGEKYAEECLVAENESVIRSDKKVSWYSTLLHLMAAQKLLCEDIQCHSVGLDYNSDTGEITYDDNRLKVFTIACPVEVIVKTDAGEEIAVLSGTNNFIKSGYEKYFFTYKIKDTEDYVKVAIVPQSYEVSLKGLGTGMMNVYVANYVDGEQQETESFIEVTITENSQGYFIASSKNENLEDLVVDGTTYIGNEEDVVYTYTEPIFTWTQDYTSCIATFSCIENGDIHTLDCNITDETIPATENSNGKIIYTANVIFNGETYTDVQTIIIPAINPPLLEDTEINSSEEDTTDTEVNSTEEDITDNEVNSSQENVTNTEQKESEEVIENPNTGDENKLFLWINVLAISSLVVIILLKKEKS